MSAEPPALPNVPVPSPGAPLTPGGTGTPPGVHANEPGASVHQRIAGADAKANFRRQQMDRPTSESVTLTEGDRHFLEAAIEQGVTGALLFSLILIITFAEAKSIADKNSRSGHAAKQAAHRPSNVEAAGAVLVWQKDSKGRFILSLRIERDQPFRLRGTQ